MPSPSDAHVLPWSPTVMDETFGAFQQAYEHALTLHQGQPSTNQAGRSSRTLTRCGSSTLPTRATNTALPLTPPSPCHASELADPRTNRPHPAGSVAQIQGAFKRNSSKRGGQPHSPSHSSPPHPCGPRHPGSAPAICKPLYLSLSPHLLTCHPPS